jgi:hypothetical protein
MKTLTQKEKDEASKLRENAINFIRAFYHPDYKRPEKTFGQIGEKWQYKHFIEPFFDPYVDRQYNEAGRDWDKTGLMGACAFAECFFKKGYHKTRVHGSDKEQAEVILDAIREKILAHHPELTRNGDVVDERQKMKFRQGPMIVNEATGDSVGATGKKVDRLIFEELHCCVKQSDRDLWNVLDTKGNTKIVINTNAGARKAGLCWEVRQSLYEKWKKGQKNVYWFSGESDPWKPSWLNEQAARERVSVPEAVFRRFYYCVWGEQGDVFTDEMITAAKRKEFLRYLESLSDKPCNFGLDFGPKHNWTALVGCYSQYDGVHKVHKKIWKPEGKVIQIADIEDYLENHIFKNFDVRRLDIETYQMISTIQKMKRIYGEDRVNEWTPTEKTVIEISENIFQLFANFRFFYPATDHEFTSELRNAELAPVSGRNGTQKDAFKILFRDQGDAGHGDDLRATAIATYFCTQNFSRNVNEIVKEIYVASANSARTDDTRNPQEQSPFALKSGAASKTWDFSSIYR